MKEGKNWGTIADLVLHILIGGLLLFLLLLIGAGAVLTSLFLLNPCTLSLGILLTSSSWGGAICICALECVAKPSKLPPIKSN